MKTQTLPIAPTRTPLRTPLRTPVPIQPCAPSGTAAGARPAGGLLLALCLALVLTLGLRPAAAQAPELMTYQGFLVDANGAALAPSTPANYPVLFRIYTAATGGTRLWSEQQIVTVDKGNFSVILGEGTPVGGESRPTLSSVLAGPTAGERYMSLSVTIGSTTSEMLPRLRMLPAPYAFLSTSANQLVTTAGAPAVSYANNRVEVNGSLFASGVITGNGSGLTGLTPAQIPALSAASITSGTLADARLSANVALRAGGNAFTGNQSIAGNLGLGTPNTLFPLTIGNNTTGDKISLYGQSGNHYGFGVGNGLLQIHTDQQSSDVAFGYGSSAAMTETLRIKGNGNVGIGTASPGEKLQIGDFATGNAYLAIKSGGGNLYRTGLRFRHFNDVIGFDIEDNEANSANGLNFIRYPNAAGVSALYLDRYSGNIGVNTIAPTHTLTVNGSAAIVGANVLQFGANVAGRDPAAGQIGYQTYTPGALDIVGAGTTSNNRRVRIWSEGGASIVGTNGITLEGAGGRFIKLSRDVNGLVLEGNLLRNNAVYGKALWDGDDNLDGYSDRRLKKDIVDAEPVLGRLMQVQVRRFHWTNQVDGDPKRFGVIAQELKPLFPDVVGRADATTDGDTLLTVKSGAFGLIAAKAVQELKLEKDALQREVDGLKAEVTALKEQLGRTGQAQVGDLQRELESLKQTVRQLAGAARPAAPDPGPNAAASVPVPAAGVR